MKRNTDKLVKIGYQEITLIDQESTFQNTFDSYGEFDHRKNTITISKDLSDLDYSCTLIHEIVHAVCYYYGLTQSGQPLDTENKEEIVVNNISNGLTSVLKDNPFILKLLANKLNVR
jgi:Zn-dependent peptidase ImmA (M78 family)